METDGDITHEEDSAVPPEMQDMTTEDPVTDSETVEHISEWDSDSSFEFDEEEWLICTPKFVKVVYNGETFPYKIVSEGPQILYGYFFVKEKNTVGYTCEKTAILTKKKDVVGSVELTSIEHVGSKRRSSEVFFFKT